jgi:hypothetical protein
MPVCIAFQLGWDMSRLYNVAAVYRPYKYTGKAKLPAQRDFGGALNTERRLAAVSSALQRLDDSFSSARLTRPSLRTVVSQYTSGAPKDDVREAIYRLHVQVLIGLQAADARLGSAYNVGRTFADVATSSDLDILKDRFSFHRVQGLRQELSELAASFPRHAARAVSNSLCIWQCVLASISGTPAQSGKGPAAALPRQTEVWRGILSGERLGTDRLEVDDYLEAANNLVHQTRSIAWGVVKSYNKALLASGLVIAAGLGTAIVVGGAGSVIAGIVAAASALGISWRGIGAILTSLGQRLRAPLWEAELDWAVTKAITLREAREAYARLPLERQRCGAEPPREPKRATRRWRRIVGQR